MASAETRPAPTTSACYTCNVRAPGGLQEHYRSPFHAHNLRLRNADLPPATWAEFSAACAAATERQAAAAQAARAVIFVCDACGKTFASEGPFDAHCKSKRHVARVKELLALRRSEEAIAAAAAADAASGAAPAAAAVGAVSGAAAAPRGQGALVGAGGDGGAAAGDDEEDEELEGEENAGDDDDSSSALIVSACNCLFCFLDHPDVESNLAHMASAHSFFPPDATFLCDPAGLLEHLLAKVVGGACLAGCSRKVFETPQAAQQHMVDARHCRVGYGTPEQVAELEAFYDYTGATAGSGGGTLVRAGELGDAVVLDGGDLSLPTGAVARHRDVVRYYKQRFRPGGGGGDRDDQQQAAAELSLAAGSAAAKTAVRLAERGGGRGGVAGPLAGGGARHSAQGARGQRREVAYWKRLAESTGIKNNKIVVRARGPGEGPM